MSVPHPISVQPLIVQLFLPHGLQHKLPCPSPTPMSTQTHVHLIGDAIQPSHPLLSPSPPAFYLLSIRVFSNESVLRIRCPKYWSFSFSISSSNEYSGLTLFRKDWLALLAVKETLKSLLHHHSSKVSILQSSAFYGPTLTSIQDYWKSHSFG